MYDPALEYHEKALAFRCKALGEDHPDVGASYYDMADVYMTQSKYDLALEYDEKAVAIRRKVLGEDHPDVGDSYNNMA